MKHPIVIITPDQLRSDYLSCYGHPSIQTQCIDQLAADGVLLENCYCASPLCAPSRISFATSTYVSEHGHRNYWSEISPDVPNLVTTLKQEGYATGMFGKNHLFTYHRLPEIWEELDEICLGNYDDHEAYQHSFSAFTMDSNNPYNITGRLTEEAESFIQRKKEQPFLLWVNYQDPHPAFTCPPPYDTMFRTEEIQMPRMADQEQAKKQPIRSLVWREHSEMNLCGEPQMQNAIRHYMGQIRYVDDCVGRIVTCLKQAGIYEETLILFFSDHGELLGDYGMFHKLPVFYDCLTRIPVILKYPQGKQNMQGIRFSGLVEEVDLVPWIFEILGIQAPITMVGKSIHPQLVAGNLGAGRTSILCEAGGGAPTCKQPIKGLTLRAPHVPSSFGPGAMIRQGPYKLTIYWDDRCELYHLGEDPYEQRNLYNDEAMRSVQDALTLALLKRILGVKVRYTDLIWDNTCCKQDVRFEPLEMP